MTGMQCITPVSLRIWYSLDNIMLVLPSFPVAVFMLFCTVLLAVGSSVLLASFLLLTKGVQTPSDCLLNRLRSFVRSAVVLSFSYSSGSVEQHCKANRIQSYLETA